MIPPQTRLHPLCLCTQGCPVSSVAGGGGGGLQEHWSSQGEALNRRTDSVPVAACARDVQPSPVAQEGQGEARSEPRRRGSWPAEGLLAGELEGRAGWGVGVQ